MKAKRAIGVAVAAALSWSYGAMAESGYGHTGIHETYGVATPFSPNEAGPAPAPNSRESGLDHADDAGMPVNHEIVTPLASNEAGPNDEMLTEHFDRRMDIARGSGSMANPQTPWSPNEAGLNTYAEDMHAREQQIAAIEHARVAAAEWNANLASSAAPLDASAAAGTTSGTSLHGRTAGMGLDERSPLDERSARDVGSEMRLPADVDRTGSLRRESEYAVPMSEPAAVGVLEVPVNPTEHTVWNVEPLTPEADLTAGPTVYPAPRHDESTAMQASEAGESGAPSL